MLQLLYPVKAPRRVTQVFGADFYINGKRAYADLSGMPGGHNGIDFGGPVGTHIYAACRGIARVTKSSKGYGNHIKVFTELENTVLESVYGHFSEIFVTDGTHVEAGEFLGRMGSTGFSTGPHLHFGIRYRRPDDTVIDYDNGTKGYIDPAPYFVETFKKGYKGMIAEIDTEVKVFPDFGKGSEAWVFENPEKTEKEKVRVPKDYKARVKEWKLVGEEMFFLLHFGDSKYNGWIRGQDLSAQKTENVTKSGDKNDELKKKVLELLESY